MRRAATRVGLVGIAALALCGGSRGFAQPAAVLNTLQEHNSRAEFRNIRIRPLKS